MGRQDQYFVALTVDNRDCGIWDGSEGGEGDSEESKYKPGGMAPQVSLGGSQERGNLTIKRLFDGPRDLELAKWLDSRRGKGRAVATKQWLDVDGLPWGDPWVYNGTLKAVTPGDYDSNGNDPDVYEVEISTEGELG